MSHPVFDIIPPLIPFGRFMISLFVYSNDRGIKSVYQYLE